MEIKFSDLMDGQLKAALTNVRPDLRFCLADADAGIAASIYKRATDEVDFFSLTSSNASVNDLAHLDFGYGLVTVGEGEDVVVYPVDEETQENGYLRGTDRRILPRAVPEELEQNFEPHGAEILDVQALLELEEKVADKFKDAADDVRQFRIRGRGLHNVIQNLPFRPAFGPKDWAQRSHVHFQPQNFHNQATEEYVFRVHMPDVYNEDDMRAVMKYVSNGEVVEHEYPVDVQTSRRVSDEVPTAQEFRDFEGSIPMIGTFQTFIAYNYRDEPYEEIRVVLTRVYEKGIRIAIQDLGPSGMRMPSISEKYYRPVSVVPSKATHIDQDCIFLLPFDGDPEMGPRASHNAFPFTLQLDDLLRITTVFDENDTIEVTYLHTFDHDAIIPVRFESVQQLDGKHPETGDRYFVRKVAYIAAIRPLINGKVVIQ